MLTGIAGSILPVLPGTPLCYLALLLQQFRSSPPFSVRFLVIWGIIVAVVILLDYLVPIYGTTKFGGSKYGIWGCTLGFLAAFWMGPWGIIFGPFIETFILLTKLTFDGSPLYRNTGYEVVAHYKCSDKFDESAE